MINCLYVPHLNHPAISSYTSLSVCLSRLWSGQQSLQGLSVSSQDMSLKGLGANRGRSRKQEEFKVVIVGDKACGKSARVKVYTQESFQRWVILIVAPSSYLFLSAIIPKLGINTVYYS